MGSVRVNPNINLTADIIQIVTDIEVTIENYFPLVGNISLGLRPREIFPTKGK